MIEIGPVDFAGPFISHLKIKEEPGILATLVFSNDSYQLLAVHSTSNMRSAALLELSYVRKNNPTVAVAVHATKEMQAEIRAALASLVWQSLE